MPAKNFKTKEDAERSCRENRKKYADLLEEEKNVSNLQMKYQDLALSVKRELDKISDYASGPAVSSFLDAKNKALVDSTQSFHDDLDRYKKEIQTQKRKLDSSYNDILEELKTYKKEEKHEDSSK